MNEMLIDPPKASKPVAMGPDRAQTVSGAATGAKEALAIRRLRKLHGPLIGFVRNVTTLEEDAKHFMQKEFPTVDEVRALAERIAGFYPWHDWYDLRELTRAAAYGKCDEQSAAIIIGLFADTMVSAEANQVIVTSATADLLTHGDENEDDRRFGLKGFSEPVILRAAEIIIRTKPLAPPPCEWLKACLAARQEFLAASKADYPFNFEHWIARGQSIAALLPKDAPLASAVLAKVGDDIEF